NGVPDEDRFASAGMVVEPSSTPSPTPEPPLPPPVPIPVDNPPNSVFETSEAIPEITNGLPNVERFAGAEIRNSEEMPEITNGLGMTFKWIPAGEFMMGSPNTDSEASQDEKPQHRVKISQPFYLGAYEVTREEFITVTGNSPWVGKSNVTEG